jgi:hypothetical protein
MLSFRKKTKVFCIGHHKTGTTSLESILCQLGYKMGSQENGEMLIKDWAKRDFKNIVKLCKTADAFQDFPFSVDFTFAVLDYAFPKSKFILTVRETKDQWYESLTNFHASLVGNGKLPTADELKTFKYRYKGFIWDAQKLIYGINEATLYDYKIYTDQYEMHNANVKEYFKYRSDDLLVVSLSEVDAMERIYGFLGFKFNGEKMPHLNKSVV